MNLMETHFNIQRRLSLQRHFQRNPEVALSSAALCNRCPLPVVVSP
jgi:hypothetical protein